jgi:hypothetical protein
MFTRTQEFTENGNQLATLRTWLRVYGRAKVNKHLGFFINAQAVHEPWYAVEEGALTSRYVHNYRHPVERPGAVLHYGKEYSEYDNINDVLREVYLDFAPSDAHKIRIGRQIVIWGEAIGQRIGDFIHPDDGRFSFIFANMEDTRIPQYMVRGIHDFELGSISTSFEWLVNPLITSKEYMSDRGGTPGYLTPGQVVGQRLSVHPEDRTGAAGVIADGVFQHGIIPSSVTPNNPTSDPDDWRFGARTTFTLQGLQAGFSYFHTQNYTPLTERGAINGPLAEYTLNYNIPYDRIGVFGNKQLTSVPGVLRFEAVYTPNMPFNIFNCPLGENCIVRRDNVKYEIAWDLNSYFYYQWHKDAPINLSLEHVGEWTPNNHDLISGLWDTEYPDYHASFSVNMGTTWLYNIFSTSVMASYDTFGDSGFVVPSVGWTPQWQNSRFSMNLQYIGLYGRTDYAGLGIFRKKDMVVLTTQLNF